MPPCRNYRIPLGFFVTLNRTVPEILVGPVTVAPGCGMLPTGKSGALAPPTEGVGDLLPDQELPKIAAGSGRWSVVAELEAGILRLPVARIDDREVLLETTIKMRTGDRFELIVERPDGHAELIHAEVSQRSSAGILMRWKPAHPRELTALERLFADSTSLEDHPDLESALRSRSRLVRTSAIAAQRDSVRVLNLSAIQDLIKDAVEDTLHESGRLLDETETLRLIKESEQGFRKKLEEFQNENADLQSRVQGLSGRLQRAQDLLGREKNREVERERFTLSESALIEMESSLGAVIEEAVKTGSVPDELEMELRSAMERSLDSERERVRVQEEQARNENIHLLERKIHRLARSLDEARGERDTARESVRRAESKDGASFAGSGADLVKGSSEDDPNNGRRRALLLDLVKENRELRGKISASKKKSQIAESDLA